MLLVSKFFKLNGGCMIKKQSGFTLMELMITIAIIAILSGIAIPNAINWRNNAQVSSAARGLYSDLQSARSMAVKENRECTVTFNTSGSGSYTISIENGDKTVNFSSYGAVEISALKDSESEEQDQFEITFHSNGFPFNDGVLSGVSVDLRGATNKRVVLTPAGSLRIETI